MNKKLKLIFRIGISLIFGGYLAYKVDWSLLATALKEVDVFLFLGSTLLIVPSVLTIACKYYLLIRRTAISHSVPSLARINLISRFYALFLPSAVGREAVRWYKVTGNRRGRAFFLAAIAFERLTFLLILLLFGLIPLYFHSLHSEIGALRGQILPAILASLLLVSIGIAYYLVPHVNSFLNSIIDRTFASRWKHLDISSVLSNVALGKPRMSAYAYVLGLGVFWQIVFVGRVFVLFKSISVPLGFLDVAWMASLVLLLQTLPISFSGIGVREGAYAYLFTVFDLPPEKGVLIGILFFSQMLLVSGIGGFLELTER